MSDKIEVVKEIRFAVVMYGGVSLAIYINGVAQELLRMVRATAVNAAANEFRFPNGDGKSLDAVEELYRDLACILGDESLLAPELLADYREWLRRRRRDPLPRLKTIINEKLSAGEPVKVARFVVDILSGSSAGGINGVYLAKALAGGQRLTKLEELWESEGDFAKLLCDERSISDVVNGTKRELGLESPTDAPSLLNSQRMYLKLLTAFDAMDEMERLPDDKDNPGGNAFVDEIDLFVTMTDYWGVPVPIRLFDQIIHERRHRQNLHFRFRKGYDGLNEFKPDYYPFLAFSARSTSSFPLAFDPMQGTSADKIIEIVNTARKTSSESTLKKISENLWETSFSPATVQDETGNNIKIEWNKRVFVDGGYLDNKPFGYAIQALAQKQSNVLIERKLVYVEPEPDWDDAILRAKKSESPFALENTLAAVTDLPRYETIREDLQQVLERNRLIVRVNQLVNNARRDEFESLRLSFNRLREIAEDHRKTLAELDPSLISNEGKPVWERLTLGELAQQKGQGVYSYYRLRVSAVNDDLAQMVTRRAGFDENSVYFLGIRDLVRYWRKSNFNRGEDGANADLKANSPLKFLADYDYNYRLRRLRFVLQQADRLLKYDADVLEELKAAETLAANFRALYKNLKPAEIEALEERFPLVHAEVFSAGETTPSRIIFAADKEALRQTVREFKKGFNPILQKLKKRLWEIDPDSNVERTESNKLRFELERKVTAVKNIILKKDDSQMSGLEKLFGVKPGDAESGRLDADFDLESRFRRAKDVIDEYRIEEDLNEIGELVRVIYNNKPEEEKTREAQSLFAVARAEARAFLASNEGGDELDKAVRAYLKHFYDNFDAYDQILFPVTYETPIGETALVDVARISPLDAPSLIDEHDQMRRERNSPLDADGKPTYKARRKVAGGVFLAFGAFFNQDWRRNDILWGRLDAAERLISIVFNENIVPSNVKNQKIRLRETINDLRKTFVEELHETMLREDRLDEKGNVEREGLVKTAYANYLQRDKSAKEFDRLTDFVRSPKYGVDRNLPEEAVYDTTSRSLAVLKQVFKEKEIGKLNGFKDVSLQGLSLLYNPRREKGELRAFLSPYLKLPVLAIGFVVLSPLILLVIALLLLWSQLPQWFVVVAGAIIFIILVIAFVAYALIKNGWQKLQTFVNEMLWYNITSEERSQNATHTSSKSKAANF
jgi:patatin-related protein